MGSRVRVACRVRPLVEGSVDGEGGEGVGVNSETNSVVFSAQAGGLSFQIDAAYGPQSTQEEPPDSIR